MSNRQPNKALWKKWAKKGFCFATTIFLFVSCNKTTDYVTPAASAPEKNFEAFWSGIDQNYIFFKYDTVDWDKMYSTYRPQVTASTTDSELFGIFSKMFSPLIDGHRLLDAGSLGSVNLLPSDYSDKHKSINTQQLVLDKYLASYGFIMGVPVDSKDSTQEFICGLVKGNTRIVYVRSRFFGTALDLHSDDFDAFLNTVNSNAYYTGLILDLRHNGGGYASTFYKLVSRFLNTTYQWGYSQVRLGADRYLLSNMIPESIDASGTGYFGKKIIILTDRYSFSSAEITTIAMKYLPNVTILGDTTGGANGPISSVKDYTGNFILPNDWTVQLAQRITFDKNKTLYEGKGLPPQIVVQPSLSDYQNGVDNVLEAAIEEMDK